VWVSVGQDRASSASQDGNILALLLHLDQVPRVFGESLYLCSVYLCSVCFSIRQNIPALNCASVLFIIFIDLDLCFKHFYFGN